MALRHRNKVNHYEPIYRNLCDHKGCKRTGKRFEVDNCLTWLCEKHQRDLPIGLFSKFKLWSI